MTMMMTNSQFGLEDMEALLWGPSSPMADAMDFLSSRPGQEVLREGGGTSLDEDISPVSPLTTSSLSSSSSPPPFYSPPPSPPPVLLQDGKAKTGSDLFSLPWLGDTGQLRQIISDNCKEDVFPDLDWMAERVDLSDFDLDTLIGSCSPTEEPPSSPEDLLASLDCPMELDSLPLSSLSTPVVSVPLPSVPSPPTSTLNPLPSVCSEPSNTAAGPESYVGERGVPSPAPCIPEPQQEIEIKSEPVSPKASCPLVESPSSPAYTLDLGSEVDVSDSEMKPVVVSVVPSQVQRLVVSLSPTRIVLVLAPREEVAIATATVTTPEAVHSSTPKSSFRSRPYPEPAFKAGSDTPCISGKSLWGTGGDEKPAKLSKAKKIKKMEQNKTAATRYRQKKKSEKEVLSDEYAIVERRNMELTERAESMAREIKYLKELMEEVRQASAKRGLSAGP
ncbi:activating transcription factor 4b [Brachionichthys hirsutus]|uniref:activating transcription factor 4b n=1 Tax=Brachionichthys hirsutus TaxID=412623 RepID=UPI003604F809